jgi:NAD(P)-dependent dehydrogenase (short-subunit alcohol dehydrogenase family)
MARIFITGSADGLGQLAARRLVALGLEQTRELAGQANAADRSRRSSTTPASTVRVQRAA